MIKRVIGVVFTIAVFVVVLVAAINFGNYRSFVFDREAEPRKSVERVEVKEAVDSAAVKKAKPKKQLTPEQIEARKRAIAKKKAERVMEKYPNVCFDLTPGWEMYLGFSRDIDAWRDFFICHSDRILFGTDSDSHKTANTKLHELVLSALTHDKSEFNMPCFGGHLICGLDLPCDVVDKICYSNFERRSIEYKAPDMNAFYDAAERMAHDVAADDRHNASALWLDKILKEIK